ncbi:MAG: hypothetical protein IPJ74_23820 [Saprospiraceae bacterium]|nr:hypothetical protein [Saprospiraceae bacterium]
MLEDLEKFNIVDSELSLIIKKYFDLNSKSRKIRKNLLGLIEIGRRILRILNNLVDSFFENKKIFGSILKEVKTDRIILKKAEKNNRIVSATINLVDEDGVFYTVRGLSKENFKIIEEENGDKTDVILTEVVPLIKSRVKLDIIISIDCSVSMEKDDRLKKVKMLQLIS